MPYDAKPEISPKVSRHKTALCGCPLYDLVDPDSLETKSIRNAVEKRFKALMKAHTKAVEIDGALYKRWDVRSDGKTRASHMRVNGTQVHVNDNFTMNGYQMFLPSDPSAPLSETANCRCTVSYHGVEKENLQNQESANCHDLRHTIWEYQDEINRLWALHRRLIDQLSARIREIGQDYGLGTRQQAHIQSSLIAIGAQRAVTKLRGTSRASALLDIIPSLRLILLAVGEREERMLNVIAKVQATYERELDHLENTIQEAGREHAQQKQLFLEKCGGSLTDRYRLDEDHYLSLSGQSFD